jgi:Peptidase M66/ToxR activated gene A lipoprotein domain
MGHGAAALAVGVTLSACMEDAESERFSQALGFFDVDRAGAPRVVRNDLQGTLTGMVQWAQSHVVDPSGNEARQMPNLVSRRQAVVLFTPSDGAAGPFTLVASVEGQPRLTIQMAPPQEIDRSDVSDAHGRPEVLYSKRAWSVRLPWDVMQKGLSLTIRSASGEEGVLTPDRITFAAPAQLTVWGMRLGMLTDPPVDLANQPMLSNPALAGTDYFQTVPVSRLTVASYEDVRLDKVMLGDGRIVSGASTVHGDVYSGDLREDVGKAQFSIGINLANYGVSSSRLGSQALTQTTTQFVYHHSAGQYANGRVVHGLSGGGAIGTLYGSAGNEWSHEIGHHFGMGHYPGCVHDKGDYFWSAHHADSGWGHIAHRKRFRSNLAFDSDVRDGLRVNGFANPESFLGHYSYNADAMSGGWVASDPIFSRYTHHTGYTAQRIQAWLNRPWVDSASPTGYRQFDAGSGRVVDAAPAGRLAPSRTGVPVFTLLGCYDPVRRVGLMYAPARANFGHVFDQLPAPEVSAEACWVDIRLADGRVRSVAVSATRLDGGLANKFHINIAHADQPLSAALSCRQSGVLSQLSSVSFPVGLPAMAPAVVIGEAAGFDALAAQELPTLEAGLTAVQAQADPMLDRQTDLLLASWRERVSQLSSDAQAVVSRRDAMLGRLKTLDQWMSNMAPQLDARQDSAILALRERLTAQGWADSLGGAPRFGPVKGEGGQCLALKVPDGTLASAQLSVVAASACASVPEQGWLMDARGALRNARFPQACVTLTPTGQLALRACDLDSVRQRWTWTGDFQLRSAAAPSQSLDINRTTLGVSPYASHGGSNQQWRGLSVVQGPLLVHLSHANVQRLYRVFPAL